MFKKSKEILESEILLKLEPPKRSAGRYLRIFLLVIFAVFSAFMFFTLAAMPAQPRVWFIEALSFLVLCGIVASLFRQLKRATLIFTNKGITDSIYFSVYWTELEYYNFVSLKGIWMKENKRILQLTSNKPPFYQFRLRGLQKYFYHRGIFFSETEMSKAEEIFRSKGISKEP